MKCLIFVIWTFFTFNSILAIPTSRNLLQFKSMVEYLTERSAFDFDGYGNYCGMGGKGDPVDAIDNCCKNHDQCYRDTSNLFCYTYFSTYDYSAKNNQISCSLTNTECQSGVCRCDKLAAECFKQHLSIYNPSFKKPSIFGLFSPKE
ncbi:basic phospholipase A2 Ts-G6D49-like isoform X1 [Brachionus plicatilis]|uniref:Phospholipase A2 n=1 Tax=Brachionus plicatilis TaxID=10195 RepID=A0A3M7SJW0_BRAPC|nr:basic phospholipase A2 Ts-G6D49-like isoform X1 [Brachionus plicatilis]